MIAKYQNVYDMIKVPKEQKPNEFDKKFIINK